MFFPQFFSPFSYEKCVNLTCRYMYLKYTTFQKYDHQFVILTHYHTMPHFDALKIYSCGKHCEERRNSLCQAISPFLTMSLPYMALIFYFKCTLKCCLQFVSIWTSLKFHRLVMS